MSGLRKGARVSPFCREVRPGWSDGPRDGGTKLPLRREDAPGGDAGGPMSTRPSEPTLRPCGHSTLKATKGDAGPGAARSAFLYGPAARRAAGASAVRDGVRGRCDEVATHPWPSGLTRKEASTCRMKEERDDWIIVGSFKRRASAGGIPAPSPLAGLRYASVVSRAADAEMLFSTLATQKCPVLLASRHEESCPHSQSSPPM